MSLTQLKDWDRYTPCLGIYPVDTLFELTSGEVGIVIPVNNSLRLRPMVSLILDGEKRPYYPTRMVSLADFANNDPDHVYGIREHLQPMQQAQEKKQIMP